MKPLAKYREKRNFKITPEPEFKRVPRQRSHRLIFVVQEHHASHLHYDFRLEWNGVLKSWAIPKGPSLDPRQKRLAVEVEDHPLAYAGFEGTIPKNQYGAGQVYRWDSGLWQPLNDPARGLRQGRLEFSLKGRKLKGRFLLIRTRTAGAKANWLLMKRQDEYAAETTKVVHERSKNAFVLPHLALLVKSPPHGKDWVHEIKFDGYRTQAQVSRANVTLMTRTGRDWTKKYPSVERALKKLKVSAVLDGEVVFLDSKGRSSFQELQNALKDGHANRLVYYVFDLLFLNGKDLTSLPLIARKERLKKLLNGLGPHVKYSTHFRVPGPRLMQLTCQHGLEGIVSKRVDTPYVSGRHDDWVKSKCLQRQELVIGGYSNAKRSRTGFGALLMGLYEEGEKLRYAGRCGTGFNQKTLHDLKRTLRKIEIKRSPFALHSPRGRDVHWVKPELVAEIAFAEWTEDQVMRTPVFYGLRYDKSPKEITLEKPASNVTTTPPLTHPDKIIFSQEKITKAQVADYYQRVSNRILPYIENRPLSLVRCPSGSSQPCFFSKHFPSRLPPNIFPISDNDEHSPFIGIHSDAGLQSLVQAGTLEIHPWNCHDKNLDRADQIVMDLDPGPGVKFEQVKQAALALKKLLRQVGIETFLKTTGGKGLHVQFPIEPVYSWAQIKNFAHTLAKELVSRHPTLYTDKFAKKLRQGKILVDYLRNGKGATSVAPYSLRARKTNSVAMPLAWNDLKSLARADEFNMASALSSIESRQRDPWRRYASLRQRIALIDDN